MQELEKILRWKINMSELPSKSSDAIRLLRDQLLPNLLREETDEILYWAGKELARQEPMNDEEEVKAFFIQHGFGEIELLQMKKNKREYNLSGDIIQKRLEKNKQAVFSLETGFLAEQIQRITDTFTEANYEVKVKKAEVHITVQMDPKEEVV